MRGAKIAAVHFQLALSRVMGIGHTLLSKIRWSMTRLHATSSVSIELEKVCVWYVQVTYEEATNKTANLRCRGDWTSSCVAQSSNMKLNKNIKTRKVEYTICGGTSSGPISDQIQWSTTMGRPYTGHSGKRLRTGLSTVNSQVK